MRDLGTWTTKGARVWGIALIVGMLLPIVQSFMGEKQLIWPWALVEMKPLFVLPLLLGIAAVVISFTMTGIAQGVALFLSGLVVMALSFILSLIPVAGLGGAASVAPESVLLVLVFIGSVISVAAGNHLRKRFPHHPAPRFLAGIAGCLLVALCVIPFDGPSLVGTLFEPMFWSMAWGIAIIYLAFFVYSVIAAISLIPFNDVTIHCRTLSILERVILVGLPGGTILMTLVYGTMFEGAASALVPLFAAMLKSCLIGYALLAIPAVGLTSWIGHGLGGKDAAAQ